MNRTTFTASTDTAVVDVLTTEKSTNTSAVHDANISKTFSPALHRMELAADNSLASVPADNINTGTGYSDIGADGALTLPDDTNVVAAHATEQSINSSAVRDANINKCFHSLFTVLFITQLRCLLITSIQ